MDEIMKKARDIAAIAVAERHNVELHREVLATAMRAILSTRADALEEAEKAVDELDVGPLHEGVIVECLEVIRSLKDSSDA